MDGEFLLLIVHSILKLQTGYSLYDTTFEKSQMISINLAITEVSNYGGIEEEIFYIVM